jgi:hypothetical protein
MTNVSPAALHLFSACAAVCTPACILWFDGTRDLNLCCELLVPCALLTSLLMRYAQAGEAGEKAVRLTDTEHLHNLPGVLSQACLGKSSLLCLETN